MNADYVRVIAASEQDRRALFAETARRVGTTEQNVEKDFWVCWTLDALFRRLPPNGPRLLFKGGTSLSKAFGLIDRLSEDIDITVFRADLGEPASVDELEALSGKQRRVRLDAISEACHRYVHGDLKAQLSTRLDAALDTAGCRHGSTGVASDENDPDGQTLLIRYPSVVVDVDSYIRPSVKIELGAKSALDPHIDAFVEPFVATEMATEGLQVRGVTTIEPSRTFWDKVLILHGNRRWFERRGEVRQGGQRVTRHYYDVHRLFRANGGDAIAANRPLAMECVRHARMFFNRPDFDLEHAAPGTFALAPLPEMLERLERDYESMSGMIFGPIPAFREVVQSVTELEIRLNEPDAQAAHASRP
jgi:hypothetical protein